jgi:uncharacterized protein
MARRGAQIERRISTRDFERFATLIEDEGTVDLVLTFSRDDHAGVFVDGKVETEVMLPCQRCLRPVTVRIGEAFRLQIVNADEPSNLAVLVAEGEDVALQDIVEDELILGVPEQVCTKQNCEFSPDFEYADPNGAVAQDADLPHPFAALDVLKQQMGSDGTDSQEE